MIEALFGDVTKARNDLRRAPAIARTANVRLRVALAAAFTGDIRTALSMANELEESRERTLTRSIHLPTVRAAIELARGNPLQAIELLKTAAPYELGITATFKPIYIRGLAYLQAGQSAKAAAEFQKIVDNRGVAPTSPFYPLSLIGLARALDRQGEQANAAASCRNSAICGDLPIRICPFLGPSVPSATNLVAHGDQPFAGL